MKKRSIIGIFATVAAVMLSVCSSGAADQLTFDPPEPEAPVEVCTIRMRLQINFRET